MRSSARVNCASRFFTAFNSGGRPLDEGRPRLLEAANLRVLRLARGFHLGELLLGLVAAEGGLRSRRGVGVPRLLGARPEVLPGLGEKLLGGRGARLQGAHLHVERAVAAAVALIGLMTAATSLLRSVSISRDRAFDLHDARFGDGQGVVGVGQALGDAGELAIGLVEQDLQRALIVLEQHDLVARGREIGFQKPDPLVRHGALVAQR